MAEGWSRFALRFSEYYDSISTDSLWTPPRLRNREWMFIPWGGGFPDRHKSFMDKSGLHSYLRSRAPHSCFHSTAYYRQPDQGKMADKGWMGADLIFDLDGDHLPGVSDNDFPAMIEVIQEQAWSLWNDFLEPDLGFDPRHVQTTFSGHRGFHIHVRDPKLLHIDSNARREIVNYIRGEGIDIQSNISSNSKWGRRVMKGIDTILEKLRIINEGGTDKKPTLIEMHNILTSRAKSPKVKLNSTSQKSIIELAELSQNSDRVDRLKHDHTLSVFGDRCTPIFWELVKGDSTVVMGTAGETDEVVTVDTKRVIRWVGSLHGKSGLKVTEFPLERLDPEGPDPFDPLVEAVAFKGGKVNVIGTSDQVSAEILGERVDLNIGDQLEVGESMAMFLCLKDWARIIK